MDCRCSCLASPASSSWSSSACWLRRREVRGTAANDDREPPQVYGSNQVELAWTVIPVLIVVVLFMATARVIHASRMRQAGERHRSRRHRPPVLVGISLSRARVVTANELHVPVSDPAQPDADIHHAAVRRHGSQLLGSSPGRQDGPDSEPHERDVD